MNEKKMQVMFGQWVKEHFNENSGVFELKLCKENNALPYSAFESQQLPSLLKAKNEFIYKKLNDADRTLKPFDCLIMVRVPAWVVIGWHHERKGIATYMIEIEVFLEEQSKSIRRSLTEGRACELAARQFILT